MLKKDKGREWGGRNALDMSAVQLYKLDRAKALRR